MHAHYLKRFEVEKMFHKSNEYLNESYPNENIELEEVSFFVLNRMHACVKATPDSIDFFFSHIYRVRTLKTKVFKKLLKFSIKSSLLRNWLIKKQHITTYCTINKDYNIHWKEVDVLFAEWDFIGVFFGERSLVTHILFNPSYYYKLKNEIDARKELRDIINIPSLVNYDLSKNGWYQDKLSVSANGHIITEKDFEDAQNQIIKIIDNTKKEIKLIDYLDLLNKKADSFFQNSTGILIQIQKLIKYIRDSPKINESKKIVLTRCHGDFNKSQLLKKDGKVYIIDWAESEQNIIWHDLVYNYIYASEETHKIDWDFVKSKAQTLFDHILKVDNSKLEDHLIVAVILIEVALKQQAAFNDNRGYLPTWSKLVSAILNQD